MACPPSFFTLPATLTPEADGGIGRVAQPLPGPNAYAAPMTPETPEEHQAFTRALEDRLAAQDGVLGLILLGSTAGTQHLPDEHSDHDFFVVVREGAQERYRAATDWLPPRSAGVLLHHRDTPHGARVIYRDGHLLEYAVFTPDELHLTRNGHARVAFDRLGDLADRLGPTLAPGVPDVPGLLAELYTHLLVGVGRQLRGEELAARQGVHNHAAGDTLGLLHALIPPQLPASGDPRNPWRRVEQTHPAQAPALLHALTLAPPEAALALLTLARGWAQDHPGWNEALARRIEQAARRACAVPG